MLAVVLFIIFYGGLCLLFWTPSASLSSRKLELEKEQPIISEDVKNTKELEELEKEPCPFDDECSKPPEVSFDSLTYQEAREVIKALNKGLPRNHTNRIKLRINKKPRSLESLQKDIELRLKDVPEVYFDILDSLYSTAS